MDKLACSKLYQNRAKFIVQKIYGTQKMYYKLKVFKSIAGSNNLYSSHSASHLGLLLESGSI